MPRRLLPSHVGPYRVEHVTAVVFFLLTVPALLAPVFITYPTASICQSVDGCKRLEGGYFKWEGVEQGNAFRKVLTLDLEQGVDGDLVSRQVVENSNAKLPWYWKMFPIREPRIEVARTENGKTMKGKKGGRK